MVGECVEDQQNDVASGDAYQRTTRGFFVWRSADNHLAFTNGHQTWMPGRRGAHVRLNTQRFSWEVLSRAPTVPARRPALWVPGRDGPSPQWLGDAPVTAWHVPALPSIDTMLGNVAATFAATEKCFAGLTGPMCGFSAGADYDAIYARDTATLQDFARYAYGAPFLAGPVEETLFLQYHEAEGTEGLPADARQAIPGDGALSGVLDFDARRGKALSTSDEETSLIHSAYVVFRSSGGVPWLRGEVNGRSVLERLNLAMDWLLTQRSDPATGLILRPHTTDWGDLELDDTGAGPAHPPSDSWTASIFDQAWTYRALRELAAMNAAAGDAAVAASMDSHAELLREASHAYLWLDRPGHFRTHLHVVPQHHPFDEDEMVSVANAVAAYTGLADEYQASRLFTALERARVQAGSATPGVSLFPSYPAGTFAHPKMDEGRYQNGGVWDWWGGIQVTAEFQRGEAELALRHLAAVGAAWQQHPEDVIEWRAGPRRCLRREVTAGCRAPAGGAGPAVRGSSHYVGVAGTVSEAIVTGLFGLDLTRDGFSVLPRLGPRNGAARVYQPATAQYLGVEQEYGADTLTVRYATNHPGPGRVAVRLPSSQPPRSATLNSADVYQYLRVYTIGRDTFAALDAAPTGRHELHLAW